MRVYPGTPVDQEFKTLGDSGHSGSLNDRQFSFLRGLGYKNSLADMMTSWLAFTPLSLFLNNEPGWMYDNSDMSTLYQDSAGTTPVTAVGQPVGLQLDKSKGLVLGPELVTNGDFSAGSTGWSLGAGWSISGGVASATSSSSGLLATPAPLTVGKVYRVTFSIVSETTAGAGVSVYVGGGSGTVGKARMGVGTYTETLMCTTSTGLAFYGRGTGTWAGSIDNISVKEIAGTHRTQSTAASRPTLARLPVTGRRNLLTYTEQFDNAVWVKSGLNTTATPPYVNVAVSPDGTQNTDFMVEDTANSQHNVRLSASMATSTAHTYSFYVKAAGRSSLTVNRFNSAVVPSFTHTFTLSGSGSSSGGAVTAVGNDWYRCSGSFTTVGAGVGGFIILLSDGSSTTYTGDGTSGIYLWGAQLELGSTATNYQKVVSIYDITEAGVQTAYGLYYDGVDDFMVTPTITPGTDKVQVFAGVRKLSDAATSILIESSVATASNAGSFYLTAPEDASLEYAALSRGSTALAVSQRAVFDNASARSPVSSVISTTHDIAGDLSAIRHNGAAGTNGTGDKGTGNFLAYPVYFGRRGGTTLPFSGYTFREIGRFGPNLDTAIIANVENWINQNTGAY